MGSHIIQIDDIRKVCRICLEDSCLMHKLSEYNELYKMTTVQILSNCYNLLLEETEELPNMICSNCKEQLFHAYDFKMKVENSHNCLQKYLSDLQIIKKEKRGIIFVKVEKSEGKFQDVKLAVQYSTCTTFDEVELKQKESLDSVEDAIIESASTLVCSCKQIFNTKTELLLHKKKHRHYSKNHSDKQSSGDFYKCHLVSRKPKHKCKICHKLFYRKYNLQRHVNIYENKLDEHKLLQLDNIESKNSDDKFQCKMCDKKLSSKDILKRHIDTHLGKNYMCKECNKTFTRSASLYLHTRIHTGEKPFSCYVCYKSFNKNQNLQRHISTHSGIRSHVCDLCDKRYTTKYNLFKHQVKHLNVITNPLSYEVFIENASLDDDCMPIITLKCKN